MTNEAAIKLADVPQLDRVFIGKGEYVRADEATKTIMDLQRNLRHWREECGKLHARLQSQPATEAELAQVIGEAKRDWDHSTSIAQFILSKFTVSLRP
jgi:hypothetical protein